MNGFDLRHVYDGTSHQVQQLDLNYSTSFTHLHHFEAAPKNHRTPHYGIFSRMHAYFNYTGERDYTKKICSSSKDYGPPHFRYPEHVYPMEVNDYLSSKNITPE